MIVSMQGSWTVSVKSKSAAFDQRFTINGTGTSADGTYPGVVGSPVVNVTVPSGTQWSIGIQNNPGTGWQASDTQLKFPHTIAGNRVFEIWSNDAGGDHDFNDLILSCSTPVNINDFIIYGNVSLYSGSCGIFNPCWHGPYIIDTQSALVEALRNERIRKYLEKLYPERIRDVIIDPNPPDPPPFKPIVIDLNNDLMEPKKTNMYKRLESVETKSNAKTKKEIPDSYYSVKNYTLVKTSQQKTLSFDGLEITEKAELAHSIESLLHPCAVEPASNVTLSFEEYDRTAAELSGGAYTGTGNRRLLGDTITDMNGNYIFRFTFDMEFPGIEDATDIAAGESMDVVAYPDVIVKVISFAPYSTLYQSAPYLNIHNLKRINLCLPASTIPIYQACFNGNIIGSLGNVFIGGNQNTAASIVPSVLRRYGDSNFLEADGKISVGSSLAGFTVNCAAWSGTIDFKGCMYDVSKPASDNTIKWYTIRIKRAGTSNWTFVTQNYLHPQYSHHSIPGYIGDLVGPFTTSLHVDGGTPVNVPAYKNIQREMHVDLVDWEYSNSDRYMQLNTALYDVVAGERIPGTFYVRVDCYDQAGHVVPSGTDMIALYIHNLPLQFNLTAPTFIIDPLSPIATTSCGLYRLTPDQMNRPIHFGFKANDPYGFVDSFKLKMWRCPDPLQSLQINHPSGALWHMPLATPADISILSQGEAFDSNPHSCSGFTGTTHLFSDSGMIDIEFQPEAIEGGWIRTAEYFTVLSFGLYARKRETNGYNTGVSNWYYQSTSVYIERLS